MSLEKPDCGSMGLSRKPCPRCQGNSYRYLDGMWTEWICWKCGSYESDTPAFKQSPELFYDIVRKNEKFFMSKYAYYARRGELSHQ
jgi:hypothetical protein